MIPLMQSNNFIIKQFFTIICLLFAVQCTAQISGDFIPFRQGEKWGFCNQEKDFIVKPQYDMIDAFSDTLMGVKKNGKWGFISKSGTLVIPCMRASRVCIRKANGALSISKTN